MVEIDTLDAETILQKAVYDDLFQIEDDFERTARKAKLFEKAKELKVISLVRDLVGKRESDLSRKRREERNKKSLTTIDNITNFYPDSFTQRIRSRQHAKWPVIIRSYQFGV